MLGEDGLKIWRWWGQSFIQWDEDGVWRREADGEKKGSTPVSENEKHTVSVSQKKRKGPGVRVRVRENLGKIM